MKKDEHIVSRQNDEYACSCGKRWEVSEGVDHPDDTSQRLPQVDHPND